MRVLIGWPFLAMKGVDLPRFIFVGKSRLITVFPQFCLPIIASDLSWSWFGFFGLSYQLYFLPNLCLWWNLFNDFVSLILNTALLRSNLNPFFCNHSSLPVRNFLLFNAGNLLLLSFLLFIKIKLIVLVDNVLCSLKCDHFQLLNLVGHDLCLILSKIFNSEYYLFSKFVITHAAPIILKSSHFNIGCNLLI